MPPASQTIVTMSFGVASGPRRASFIGWPSIGVEAVEVQELRDRRRDARERHGPLDLTPAGTNPGPYQSIGTSWT